jgi:hypothetical protein
LSQSFRDGPKDQTSDAQLRIGESRDSGFDASHRPGMTPTRTFAVSRRRNARGLPEREDWTGIRERRPIMPLTQDMMIIIY